MKKIALILATIMVLSVALVACGGGETSETASVADTSAEASKAETSKVEETSEPADDSSEPADDSSEPADDSSEPADDSSEPADDSSEPADDSSEPNDDQPTGTNLAAGKPYTHSGQFQAGGAEVNWGWSDTAPISYPDENNKTLTDGAKDPAELDYKDAVYAGFTSAQPEFAGYTVITIDLGASTAVKGAAATMFTKVGDGIGAPAKIEVYVSATNNFDGAALLGTVNGSSNTDTATFTVNGNATGQFVQFRFYHAEGCNWIMVSELEVY